LIKGIALCENPSKGAVELFMLLVFFTTQAEVKMKKKIKATLFQKYFYLGFIEKLFTKTSKQ